MNRTTLLLLCAGLSSCAVGAGPAIVKRNLLQCDTVKQIWIWRSQQSLKPELLGVPVCKGHVQVIDIKQELTNIYKLSHTEHVIVFDRRLSSDLETWQPECPLPDGTFIPTAILENATLRIFDYKEI